MKAKIIGAISGLVAALGLAGCADLKDGQFACTAKGVEVKVNYLTRGEDEMEITKIVLYIENELFVQIPSPVNFKLVCDDGQIIETSGYYMSDRIYKPVQGQ